MNATISEIIVTMARIHRLPVHPDLFAICDWEVQRAKADDPKELIDALLRGFRFYENGLSA